MDLLDLVVALLGAFLSGALFFGGISYRRGYHNGRRQMLHWFRHHALINGRAHLYQADQPFDYTALPQVQLPKQRTDGS